MDFKALRQKLVDEAKASRKQTDSPAASAASNPSPPLLHLPTTSANLNLTSAWQIGFIPMCRFIGDVLSVHDERQLIACILAWGDQAGRWVELRDRRLQEYGGKPTRDGLLNAEALPPWLACLSQQLVSSGLFPPSHPPNHALINEYAPGEGILPHTDGPAYYPCVATISLGSQAIMLYEEGYTTPTRACMEVVLPPRSMVITSDMLYSSWLHSIPGEAEGVLGTRARPKNGDTLASWVHNGEPGQAVSRTGPRWSITLRHVPPLPGTLTDSSA